MELYHAINRGIDGRKIFMDDSDRARFVHDLFEFNDTAPALEYNHALARARTRQNVGRRTSYIRERLVDIHGWKLVSNHFHLLISERVEDGLVQFIRKLTGYGRYFNERHERRGPLFQGGKKILIENERHFLYILHYIHLNALDDLPGFENWRERDKGGIPSLRNALAHLQEDRWSSYRDYCGNANFPSILTKTLFEERPGGYEADLKEFLKERLFENFDQTLLEYSAPM